MSSVHQAPVQRRLVLLLLQKQQPLHLLLQLEGLRLSPSSVG